MSESSTINDWVIRKWKSKWTDLLIGWFIDWPIWCMIIDQLFEHFDQKYFWLILNAWLIDLLLCYRSTAKMIKRSWLIDWWITKWLADAWLGELICLLVVSSLSRSTDCINVICIEVGRLICYLGSSINFLNDLIKQIIDCLTD